MEASKLDLKFLDFSTDTRATLSPRVKLAVSRSAKRSKQQPAGSAGKYQTKLNAKALNLARHSLSNLLSPRAASVKRSEFASVPVSPKVLFREEKPSEFDAKGYVHGLGSSSADYTSQSLSVDADQLLNPIPKSKGILQCKLRRSKKHNELSLYLQSGKDRFIFLMSARKRRIPGPARFIISSRTIEFQKDASSHIGKLEGDLFREKYNLFEAPLPSKPKLQLGCIFFEVSEDCPRKSTLLIPELDESGKPQKWQAKQKKQTLFESYAKSRKIMDMRTYNNTLPHYDPQIDRYVLDLNARATMPSVKNTIVHGFRGRDKQLVWLFGKTGENEFNVDMAWPFSPVQAFGFAIATLHSKS